MPGESRNNALSPRLVYCIIVTYNGLTWIAKCLDSLAQGSYPCPVLVIDNGSTDGTLAYIEENFPHIRLIRSEKNMGFGQANNIGLKMALEEGAEHVFLLNQDAWVEVDTIRDLVAAQVENPQFGILSPLHLNGLANALDSYFAGYLMQSDLKEWTSSWLLGWPEHPLIVDTHFVNAAAWLISAGCLRRTGGFDPIFFHYGEDLNYAQRVLFHGFRIGIHTGARICHDREQRIASLPSPAAQLKKDRNHFLNQACDIRQDGFMALSIRRSVRYSLLMSINLFNTQKLTYNFQMARAALALIPSIRKSRRSAVGKFPFLKMGNDPSARA
ncbi:MAG TPA: glycosyltransferase family 2 protein [Puia sp.]|nr:glycosyltransferase family 2 protein [Puia sp.]